MEGAALGFDRERELVIRDAYSPAFSCAADAQIASTRHCVYASEYKLQSELYLPRRIDCLRYYPGRRLTDGCIREQGNALDWRD